MSSEEMDAEIDRAVADAKAAAGLNPDKKYPPIEFHEHIDARYVQAFWHRHTRRGLDQMLAEARGADV